MTRVSCKAVKVNNKRLAKRRVRSRRVRVTSMKTGRPLVKRISFNAVRKITVDEIKFGAVISASPFVEVHIEDRLRLGDGGGDVGDLTKLVEGLRIFAG